MENRLTALPNEIGSLIALQQLDISSNNIKLLPPDLGALENIQEFSLSLNPVNLALYSMPNSTNLCGSQANIQLIDELDREAKKGREKLWEYLKSDEYFKIYYARIGETVEEQDKKLSGKDKQY